MYHIEQAVKRLTITKKDGGEEFSTCFPFYWDGKFTWFVTSAHVLEDAKSASFEVEKKNAVIEYFGNPIDGFDIAILKIRKKIKLPKEIMFQHPPDHTVKVKIVGWPAKKSIFQGQGTANKTGSYVDSSLPRNPKTEKLEVLLHRQYLVGLSGSPIIKSRENGAENIIGVLRAKDPNETKKGYAVSIEALQIIAKKQLKLRPTFEILRPSLNISVVCPQQDLNAYQDFLIQRGYSFEHLLNKYIEGGKRRPWQIDWVQDVNSKSAVFSNAEVIVVLGGGELKKQLVKAIDEAIENREAKEKLTLCVVCQITYDLPDSPKKESHSNNFRKIRSQYLIDLGQKEKIALFDNVITGIDNWWKKNFSGKHYDQTAAKYLDVIRNADENKLSKRTLDDLVEDSKNKVSKRGIPMEIQRQICEAAEALGARKGGPYLTEKQLIKLDKILLDWEETINMKKRNKDPRWIRWVLRANGLHPQAAQI